MDDFPNFVYISNYLHLKSFVWERDFPISSKLQTSWIWPRSFKKALIELNFDLILTFKLTLLWLYSKKSCKTTLFRKPTEISENKPTLISIEPPITKKQHFKNMKNLCFFGGSFFKKKKLLTFGIFNESNIWANICLSYLKNWGVGVNSCWITTCQSCYFISLYIV